MPYDFILTTDRTMMTDHHGKEFLGFLATGPAYFLPESLWYHICCPKPKVDDEGKPVVAPYGLRKIEAALIDAGFNATVIDPDHIDKYVRQAKAILIGHHDFFAYGPPSSEWWLITGKEPVNRKSLMRLMEKIAALKRKYNFKIIVGGPAAWQWLWEPELWEKWGVDTVVDGEAELIIKDIAHKILNNDELPRYIYVGPNDVPRIEEIPIIKGASVNGLIEVMRGCPRGCKFCSVTLRPLRYIPLEKIEKEIIVNVKAGIKHGIIHSEDVLLYGAKGVIPQEKPLLKLHEVFLKYFNNIAWAHASLAAIVVAEGNGRIIGKLMDMIYSKSSQNHLGVEVGIETGSPRLAKIIMPAKSAPYPPERWPEIVEEAFAIMHDYRIIPAATFILNLPGETPDDVMKTVELIERLKPYRSIIVPMFFVPMGGLKGEKNIIARVKVTREHVEALKAALYHTVFWAKDIMEKFYISGMKYALIRRLLNTFIDKVLAKAEEVINSLHDFKYKELSISKPTSC